MKSTNKITTAKSRTTDKTLAKMSGATYGEIKGDIFTQTRKMTQSVKNSFLTFIEKNKLKSVDLY